MRNAVQEKYFVESLFSCIFLNVWYFWEETKIMQKQNMWIQEHRKDCNGFEKIFFFGQMYRKERKRSKLW